MEVWNRLVRKAGSLAGALLPVDSRKVVFSSYGGKGYGDNLRPVAEALREKDPALKFVWLTADEQAAASLPAWIRACPYDGFRRGLALGTAKVWVDNCRKGARFKKPNQRYMQTWHGFALKRIEGDASQTLPPEYQAYAMRDAKQTDVMVSDSRHMTGIYQSAFWYDGPILACGAPRNDALIRGNPAARERVRAALGLSAGEKLALYAPTFRADRSLAPYTLDFDRLQAACEARFGGRFRVALRLHPNVAEQAGTFAQRNPGLIHATDYPDGQELLAATDVLITDYSSIIFDFMLTGRPCFQFATDIEDYRNDRDFYLSLDQLPFALARDNEEMERAVLGFQEEPFHQAVEAFIQELGIITTGCAAERCADWILEQMGRTSE